MREICGRYREIYVRYRGGCKQLAARRRLLGVRVRGRSRARARARAGLVIRIALEGLGVRAAR